MDFLSTTKGIRRSLFGIVGLSAIAFSLSAPAAHAGILRRGFDFWKTLPGTQVNFDDVEGFGPGVVIPAGAFTVEGLPSDEFTIPSGLIPLVGHPTGTMGLEQEQQTVVCFDMHGNAVSGDSEHAVQCLPEPDPEGEPDPLEWTDTIVERLEGVRLKEIGDVGHVPIALHALSLVTEDSIPLTFGGGQDLGDFRLKIEQGDEQIVGHLKLTVEDIFYRDGYKVIRGLPSIGTPGDDPCRDSVQAFLEADKCVGLPVSFTITALKDENDELIPSNFDLGTGTLILEDGTQDPDRVFFEFHKIPEPSATLATILVGFGSMAALKRRGNVKK
jgi:hypothetical protein